MPLGDLRLKGRLVEVRKPVFLEYYPSYATNVVVDTGEVKMPLTVLGEVPESWLNTMAVLEETYEHNKKDNTRIFLQNFYSEMFRHIVEIEKQVVF